MAVTVTRLQRKALEYFDVVTYDVKRTLLL